MLIDVYGSRTHLMSLFEVNSNLNLVVSNIFIGTSIESQGHKEMNVIEEKMDNVTSPYELIELYTDMSKRFRRFNSFTKSNVIILDLQYEGRDIIKFKSGSLVNRPVLLRYGYSQGNGQILRLEDKIKNIHDHVKSLVDYIQPYDLVILNKLRSPKYVQDEEGKIQITENIAKVNFMNYYAETFEDLLLKEVNNIQVIPEYKNSNELIKGYQKEEEYKEFLEYHLGKILKENSWIK